MSDKFENSNDELFDNMFDLDEEDRKITLEDEETERRLILFLTIPLNLKARTIVFCLSLPMILSTIMSQSSWRRSTRTEIPCL